MNILPNTSVLFRYFKAESPYIKAFIYHYKSLGVKHFISIVQSEEDKQGIEKHFSQLDLRPNLYTLEMPHSWQTNRCLRSFDHRQIPNIQEFILNVDCDEFLYIENNAEVIDLPKKMLANTNRINLKWTMVANSSALNPSCYGFHFNIGKDLARTNSITGMPNVHSFSVSEFKRLDSSPNNHNLNVRLAHHWGRTFRDTLIKICYQQKKLSNAKNSDFTCIYDFISLHELPRRFRYMAFLEESTKNIDIRNTNHQNFYDLEEEELLLSSYATTGQIEKLLEIYKEYRQLISNRGQDYIRNCISNSGANDACKNLISLQELASTTNNLDQ